MSEHNLQRGISWVEVIIILTMISILIYFGLSFYNPFIEFQKANDSRRKSDLKQLQTVLEQYYQSQGHYPPSSKNYKIINFSGQEINWGQKLQPFIDTLPQDPFPPRTYVYYATRDKLSYWLYASLERTTEDLDTCNHGQPCISLTTNNISPYTVCGGICNYAVTSPNVVP